MAEDQQGMENVVDALAVLSTRDLITVGIQGDEVRRRMHGARTTFGRVLEMHVQAPPAALPPGVVAGEVRIVGQLDDERSAQAAVGAGAALARGLDKGGSAPLLSGFSLSDLTALAGSTAALEALCVRLRAAGLEAIAEVPVDQMPLNAAVEAIRAARSGGLSVMRATVRALRDEDRITVLEHARDLQDAVGGLRAFAPLPRTMSVVMPTTGYDDVKLVALARMLVTNIDSIQVDWPLYGPKLAQVALTVGADDVDGIEAADPGVLGTRRSPIEEIKTNIRAAALEPVERDGRFNPL
jgi:CofH/MqnC C-terminal region